MTILWSRPVVASFSNRWLTRAEQARRVAAMLSNRDATLLEAYAEECEAKAGAPTEEAQHVSEF